jgi:hypothetical protein
MTVKATEIMTKLLINAPIRQNMQVTLLFIISTPLLLLYYLPSSIAMYHIVYHTLI